MDASALKQVTDSNDEEEPVILQEIRIDDSITTTTTFPVKPPLETVGEFKVTPMIHAGYAVTWFGLASAGLIMTRKLITRGR